MQRSQVHVEPIGPEPSQSPTVAVSVAPMVGLPETTGAGPDRGRNSTMALRSVQYDAWPTSLVAVTFAAISWPMSDDVSW